jgi:hypothetical protein
MSKNPVIVYRLSKKGQRDALTKNVDAAKTQEVLCPDDEKAREIAIHLAMIHSNGEARCYLGHSSHNTASVVEFSVEEKTEYYTHGSTNQRFYYPRYAIKEKTAVIEYDYLLDSDDLVVTALLDESSRLENISNQYDLIKAEVDRLNKKAAAEKEKAEQERNACEKEYLDGVLRAKGEQQLKKQKKIEEEQRRLEEIIAWCKEHGSERLRMIAEDGYIEDSLWVYREERLKKDRPGWIFDKDWMNNEVYYQGPRNPPLDALRWSREVKKDFPSAELCWARGDIEVKEYVMKDVFLSHDVVLRHPS